MPARAERPTILPKAEGQARKPYKLRGRTGRAPLDERVRLDCVTVRLNQRQAATLRRMGIAALRAWLDQQTEG